MSTLDVDAVLVLLERDDVDLAIDTLRSIRANLNRPGPIGSAGEAPAGGVTLTTREGEILRCLSDGAMSQKDVARRLGVTRNTVKTHLKSAYLKLGAHSRSEALQLARQFNLLGPSLHGLPSLAGRDDPRSSATTTNRDELAKRRTA